MSQREFWNKTDHSVTVDAEGRQVDGGSYTILEPTEETDRAVKNGLLDDRGEFDLATYDGPAVFATEPESVGYVDTTGYYDHGKTEEVNTNPEGVADDTSDASVQAAPESGTLAPDTATAPPSTTKKKGK